MKRRILFLNQTSNEVSNEVTNKVTMTTTAESTVHNPHGCEEVEEKFSDESANNGDNEIIIIQDADAPIHDLTDVEITEYLDALHEIDDLLRQNKKITHKLENDKYYIERMNNHTSFYDENYRISKKDIDEINELNKCLEILRSERIMYKNSVTRIRNLLK